MGGMLAFCGGADWRNDRGVAARAQSREQHFAKAKAWTLTPRVFVVTL
jgi:hypothetical protein